jgi:hypothetical protein
MLKIKNKVSRIKPSIPKKPSGFSVVGEKEISIAAQLSQSFKDKAAVYAKAAEEKAEAYEEQEVRNVLEFFKGLDDATLDKLPSYIRLVTLSTQKLIEDDCIKACDDGFEKLASVLAARIPLAQVDELFALVKAKIEQTKGKENGRH